MLKGAHHIVVTVLEQRSQDLAADLHFPMMPDCRFLHVKARSARVFPLCLSTNIRTQRGRDQRVTRQKGVLTRWRTGGAPPPLPAVRARSSPPPEGPALGAGGRRGLRPRDAPPPLLRAPCGSESAGGSACERVSRATRRCGPVAATRVRASLRSVLSRQAGCRHKGGAGSPRSPPFPRSAWPGSGAEHSPTSPCLCVACTSPGPALATKSLQTRGLKFVNF